MGHAGGEPADGSQTAREFDLVFDAPHRLRVPHAEQRADAFPALGDEIERNLNAAAVLQLDLALRNPLMKREGVEHDPAQLSGVGENGFHHAAQNFAARAADEALGRGADQHDASVTREQHQAVLQRTHDLVEIFLQGAEHFLDIADLPAQAIDLGVDHPVFVCTAGIGIGRWVGNAGGHLIETPADGFQRT